MDGGLRWGGAEYRAGVGTGPGESAGATGRPDRIRIVNAIDELAGNPARGTALKGELRGLRRIRVGDFRVVYEVKDEELLVLVVRVRHRREVHP